MLTFQEIRTDYVFKQLQNNGFHPKEISKIDGGSNHHVFAIDTDNLGPIIVKYPKIRPAEGDLQLNGVKEALSSDGTNGQSEVTHTDTMFGGLLSLEREAYLFDLIRDCGLPTPLVHGIFNSSRGKFIVVDRSPGGSHKDFLEGASHSCTAFTDSMKSLGESFSVLHARSSFPSFGDIMVRGEIFPSGIVNFADRCQMINDHVLHRCMIKECLNESEMQKIERFLRRRLNEFRPILDIKKRPARLVITDIHGDNFFVDESGQPSGFFDVESSQAAPAEFELYALRFFMFNYYDKSAFMSAEEAFWEGYFENSTEASDSNNGERDRIRTHFSESDELLDFFSACRLLEVFQSYWGVKDGVRDTWGMRIKDLFLSYMESGRVDYIALGTIWRERDRQPEYCLSS